ncbi:endo-arabinase [Flavobacterium turcicum]|uniref:Endo-arabinase n=1 Tax=Flavobacterium turcicum TaxID=2764718 RepID=A0ABR7JHT2_9FLAO|nr:endo-arabinase [Flavobacterium turcicum]MBC5864050.1 endo-arabinase [Flavobacterium turcicum]NHL02816.1 endo-arabinase [Flavobacterium turcicum]
MKFKLCTIVVLFCISFAFAQKEKDQEQIKKLLERESSTWRLQDAKGHAECWYIQPYSRILVSTADGKTYDVPPSAMTATDPQKMGNGGSAVNSNYKMNIQKQTAWVSHDEISIGIDGRKTYSYEIRLLEKIKKKWKLVGQSIHIYKLE